MCLRVSLRPPSDLSLLVRCSSSPRVAALHAADTDGRGLLRDLAWHGVWCRWLRPARRVWGPRGGWRVGEGGDRGVWLISSSRTPLSALVAVGYFFLSWSPPGPSRPVTCHVCIPVHSRAFRCILMHSCAITFQNERRSTSLSHTTDYMRCQCTRTSHSDTHFDFDFFTA